MWSGGQGHVPAALPPGKRHSTCSTGGWVGSRAGIEGSGESRPLRYWIPGPSNPYRMAIPAHQINCVPSINQHRIPLLFVNELRQRNRENGRFATPPERQVSLTRISWNLNSELLTAYSTLTFTCTAIIDTSPRALCGSIKIRTIVQLNSWAQPLSSLSSMSLFPVTQYQDNPLHFLGR